MDLETRVAELEAALEERDALIAELRKTIAELQRKLGQNSSNSSKPPSSDAPADRELRKKGKRGKGKRKRGGQPGHKGHRRTRVPPEQVSQVHDIFPETCQGCRGELPQTPEEDPVWHQTIELPRIEPVVDEYRMHAVTCSCGCRTRAPLPPAVPQSPFGPRLMATVGLLTGAHRVSRRDAQSLMAELFGVEMSLGAVSNCERRLTEAVAGPVQDAVSYAVLAAVKYVDATGWLLNHKLQQLWTIATHLVTAFCITPDGTMATVKSMLGEAKGIMVSDRATAFGFWAMDRRQVCWAHLVRKFVAFREMDDPIAARIGADLIAAARAIFRLWWRMKAGEFDRATLQKKAARHCRKIEQLLEQGEAHGILGLSGSCADMLNHRPAFWTFIDTVGVDPTNNLAERELRRLVQWRKTSFGSQSLRGLDFVTHMATVSKTIAAQTRANVTNTTVLDYLHQACLNTQIGEPSPSLIPESRQPAMPLSPEAP